MATMRQLAIPSAQGRLDGSIVHDPVPPAPTIASQEPHTWVPQSSSNLAPCPAVPLTAKPPVKSPVRESAQLMLQPSIVVPIQSMSANLQRQFMWIPCIASSSCLELT
jgi:hypothetical protein